MANNYAMIVTRLYTGFLAKKILIYECIKNAKGATFNNDLSI